MRALKQLIVGVKAPQELLRRDPRELLRINSRAPEKVLGRYKELLGRV